MSAVLPVRQVAKPWGRDLLPQPFVAPRGERIGEIWFEPPPELDQLLVKYIFTSEKLSVQVHPSEQQLPGHGKEECWLVIDAQPGAELGIGFREPISAEAMRTAALDGSIEDLLVWHPVHPGDFFYIPANTIHAIGAGVSLIEVQQNSDVTYRLYDYGRPRELHLDEAMGVAKGVPYPPDLHMRVPDLDDVQLTEGPWFRFDQIQGLPTEDVAMRYGTGPLLVIPRKGGAHIGMDEIRPGGCGLAMSFDSVAFDPGGTCLIAQPCAS
jgi:mannose-6-phosphate isomerase